MMYPTALKGGFFISLSKRLMFPNKFGHHDRDVMKRSVNS